MQFNSAVLDSVQSLGYRVTIGDVAVQAGLDLYITQQNLIGLAANAGGNLQVSETGEIVYCFPENFRAVLNSKFWQLRLNHFLSKTWQVCFYLIRIFFGIFLILSILLMLVAIVVIIYINATQNSKEDDRDEEDRDNGINIFSPNLFNMFYIFDFGGHQYTRQRRSKQNKKSKHKKKSKNISQLNFFEAVFSFLFGDGNPNAELEEKRWQSIGTVIRNHQGAIVAEQVAPYLDHVPSLDPDNEDYILPVLMHFNGQPEVSPEGGIIYLFPEVQVMAKETDLQEVESYLREELWQFSEASSGQILTALGLGLLNFILAIVLGVLLQQDLGVEVNRYLGFINAIYGVLCAYAAGFLTIPSIRFFVLKLKNWGVVSRNEKRQQKAELLITPSAEIHQKLKYARQFASRQVITNQNLVYSTDQELLEQEIERSDQIDQEWNDRKQ